MHHFSYSSLALALLLGGCSHAAPPAETPAPAPAPTGGGAPRPRAVFILIDSTGTRNGQITATEGGGSVVFEILVHRLAPGPHGLHLHQSPACDPPGFTTAGPHFNPTSLQHGVKNPLGPHAGDLPNLMVTPDSIGRGQFHLPGYTLATGPHSIATPGSALVIHANPDDERTDPAGNSGARVACAVIQLP